MRNLLHDVTIDTRLQRPADNASGIMTKKIARDMHAKKSNEIQNGQTEDVKQDKPINKDGR